MKDQTSSGNIAGMFFCLQHVCQSKEPSSTILRWLHSEPINNHRSRGQIMADFPHSRLTNSLDDGVSGLVEGGKGNGPRFFPHEIEGFSCRFSLHPFHWRWDDHSDRTQHWPRLSLPSTAMQCWNGIEWQRFRVQGEGCDLIFCVHLACELCEPSGLVLGQNLWFEPSFNTFRFNIFGVLKTLEASLSGLV